MDEYQIPEPVTPPTPQLKRKRSRWLLPILILASVLVVLLGLLAYAAVVLLKDSGFKGVVDKAKLIADCEMNLTKVSEALERYNIGQGHYPPRLETLYPDYLPSKSALHCPADPSDPKAVTTSYIYKAPAEDAPDDTVVCVCKFHQIMKDQAMELRLLKNGKVETVATPSR